MSADAADPGIPNWVPPAALVYLAHTESGLPIRQLARAAGCHASTVLRQIRRIEQRRDDPLVDSALRSLGRVQCACDQGIFPLQKKDALRMNSQPKPNPSMASDTPPDEATVMAQAGRILRRLCETGAVLAVATDMEKAVIVRDGAGGATTRTGVVPRKIAEALALKNWISTDKAGRITRYKITAAGRSALEKMIGHEQTPAPGFAEGPAPFADQHRQWGEKTLVEPSTGRPRRMRYNLAESPLTALARRKDKTGEPFLGDDLVTAGERLREDFELAQMGPRVTQNWDRFLTSGGREGYIADSGVGDGSANARKRVAAALADLGPGLSDVALRCCCYLEGLERAEKHLGWSARSGKIVLRIALTRLRRHYDETLGPGGPMIG
jgi:DNA-binding MarR family transcriptional regulator